MKNTDKKYLIGALAGLTASLLAVCWHAKAGQGMTEATALHWAVQEMTASYRLRQIVATMAMYAVGYLAVYPFCGQIGGSWAGLLAMTVGNALWGVVSALLLFVNIPYNRVTMSALTILLLAGLGLRFRESYREMGWCRMCVWLTAALSVTVMASSGMFARFFSSDSYYFVMQYGELIAKEGRLSSDIAGIYMTWTGIIPALISSFAAMWGFENIYAIHYLLVFSMYGFIALLAYRSASAHWGKRVSFLIASASLATVMLIPGVTYLSFWIINNTYFMIYILPLVMLPVVAGGKPDGKVICILSLLFVWLTLCRPETALVMCFFIICVSSLGLSRRQAAALYVPMCIGQMLFFGKLLYEYAIGARQADSKMLTVQTAAVLVLALALTGVYVGIYRLGWVCYIRKHLREFVLGGLLLACLGLGLLDLDKLWNNLAVVLRNSVDWYWNYVMIVALAMEILKSLCKCRNRYYDLIIGGFVLCNFAVCMGRPHGLRLGIGDSYNRICMSVLPLYVVSTVLTFLEHFGRENGGLGARKESGHGALEEARKEEG